MVGENERKTSLAPYSYIYALCGSRAHDLQLRNLVIKAHYRTIMTNLLATGHSVKVDDEICRLREKLGLNKLPPTTLVHKKALEDLRIIIREANSK